MIMKVQLAHVHWSRVLFTGVEVVILVVILDAILTFLAFQAHIVPQVVLWSTLILSYLVTVGGGVSIARKVEREALLHGFLVGLVVALISFLLSLVFSQSFGSSVLVVLGDFALTVVSGWLGGVLGSRVRRRL
jgi:putative membrane protein (TIGR04086 family)